MKIKIVLITLMFFPLFGFSQKVELTPMAGYMWGGSFKGSNGEYKITDGINYGIALDVPIPKGIKLELFYTRLDSELQFKGNQYSSFLDTTFFGLSTNYLQIGGLKELETGTDLVPFGILTVGTTIFSPKNKSYSDEWMVSFGLGGGLKYFISEKIGLRLDGRFLFPIYFTGGGIFCGTGGCGGGLGGTIPIVQGFVDGGIIFRLGE